MEIPPVVIVLNRAWGQALQAAAEPVQNAPAPMAETPKAKAPSQRTGLSARRNMEREKRLELSTYTLARYRSTN
jgi:hypothetical protein